MRTVIIIVTILIFTHTLFAQESDVVDVQEMKTTIQDQPEAKEAAQSSRRQNIEKISVTGSRIKRIDVEGPSPVLTLDREFLDRSGYNSVADVLRDTTVSSFGVEREYSDETNSVGAATIGLRGLGADRTLVLMDGRRLPKIDGGNSVDLNLIPFEAIERVEILKDGASAVYGSDALAGVINFITKKDYDGAVVKTRYSRPELRGGARQEISATYGKNFSRGNFLAVYQYRNNSRLMDRDRDWSKGGLSTYGSPPSVRKFDDASKWQAAKACPEGQVLEESDGSSFCTFDYSVYTTSLPDTEQHSAMLKGEYELKDGMNAFATTTYTRRQIRWQWAPSADNFTDQRAVGGKNYVVPQKVSQKPGANQLSGDFEMRYRTVQELGARVSRDTTNAYGAVAGVRGELLDTWEWETSVNYGLSELNNIRHGGYGNRQILFDSMLNNKMLPFAQNSQKNFLPNAHHIGDQIIRSNVTSAQFVSSGNLADLSIGQLNMATGVSGTWESYEIEVDEVTAAGDLFGGIGESGFGQRNYQSFFSELGLNMGSFEVQLAGRFDNYSDFGSTVNPKLSMRYSPFSFLMLRGSAGTGFRAPSLAELYSTSNYRYPWFTDTQACATIGGSYCGERQYQVFSGGNPNLKEERSISYNFGAVMQPTRRLSIAMDYWETRVKNAVGLDFNDLMFAESQLGNAVVRAAGVDIRRQGGIISGVVAPNLNLAQQQSRGLEVVMGYSMKLGALNIRPQIDHSQLFENREEVFPGLGFRNKLGEQGRPAWKNTASVSFGLRDHGLRLMARTIAGQFKIAHFADPTKTGRIPTYTEYDMHYDYSQFFGGQFSFGVKNLLASNRPIDDTAGFANRFNPGLYDQLGRMFYMGYAYNF